VGTEKLSRKTIPQSLRFFVLLVGFEELSSILLIELGGYMKEKEIIIDKVCQSFFKSFMWVVITIICAVFFTAFADVVKTDFLHSNPYRTQREAALMPFIFTPFMFIIVLFGITLTFGCSQFVQAFLAKRLIQKYGSRGLYGIVLSVPLVAVLSWYCYDYQRHLMSTLVLMWGQNGRHINTG
jgi:magnesium-transporting ATPase (P-type)